MSTIVYCPEIVYWQMKRKKTVSKERINRWWCFRDNNKTYLFRVGTTLIRIEIKSIAFGFVIESHRVLTLYIYTYLLDTDKNVRLRACDYTGEIGGRYLQRPAGYYRYIVRFGTYWIQYMQYIQLPAHLQISIISSRWWFATAKLVLKNKKPTVTADRRTIKTHIRERIYYGFRSVPIPFLKPPLWNPIKTYETTKKRESRIHINCMETVQQIVHDGWDGNKKRCRQHEHILQTNRKINSKPFERFALTACTIIILIIEL